MAKKKTGRNAQAKKEHSASSSQLKNSGSNTGKGSGGSKDGKKSNRMKKVKESQVSSEDTRMTANAKNAHSSMESTKPGEVTRRRRDSSQSQKSQNQKPGQETITNPAHANTASSMTDSTTQLKQGAENVQNVIQNNDLTPKQDIFCREYLVDLNATQAAIRAGYSKETAQQMGSENLSKPVIQRRISSYMRERISRIDITQEMVIRELCKIAFANIKEFLHLDENGNTRFIDFDEVDSDKATAISEVTVMYTQTGNKKTKLKMHDKMEALKLIGQHLGMFKIGIDANVKQLPGEYDLSKFSTDQLKTFMELTRILSETQGK